jgi:hypothetical protein
MGAKHRKKVAGYRSFVVLPVPLPMPHGPIGGAFSRSSSTLIRITEQSPKKGRAHYRVYPMDQRYLGEQATFQKLWPNVLQELSL